MKIVRFYLGVLTHSGWQNNSYRDFDELLTFWLEEALNQGYTGLFHVGSEKPRYDLIELNFECHGRLFITASAKWGIRDLCKTTKNPVLFIEKMPIFMALDGWGYECDEIVIDQTYANPSRESSQNISNIQLAEKQSDFSNILIETLHLPVRAINCLTTAKLSTLDELYSYTIDELKLLPNLGNKTINDINIALTRLDYPSLSNFSKGKRAGFTTDDMLPDETEIVPSRSLYSTSENFPHLLELIFANLSERQVTILQKRMGYKLDSPMTLEELGKHENITKEGIRQIEVKALSVISRDIFWNNILINKLVNIIDKRTSAMTVAGLNIFDTWFSDLENHIEQFKYILSNTFKSSQFHVININEINYISRLNQNDWESLLKRARKLLEESIGKVTRIEAKKQIEYFFSGKGIDLLDELFKEACEQAYFADETDNAILIGYGKSAESLCEALLINSEYPLHYSEVKREIEKRFGKSLDVRRVHNALGQVSYLFGRGTYGLDKHCLLNQEERYLITQEVIEAMSNGYIGRQWSLKELLEILYMGDFGDSHYEDRLDIYNLDFILKQCDFLQDLGRHTYQLDQAGNTYSKRIDLKEAVISILKEAGKPLSYDEIKQKIKLQRGLGVNFQIHPKGSLITVASGIWGLIERDLPISSEQQYELCDVLEALLERLQKGIHVTEIKKLIDIEYPPALNIYEPSCIFSIAQKLKSNTITSSHEDYIYLKKWGNQRRLTRVEAVRQVISRLPSSGRTMHEIVNDVCLLIDRKTSSLDFSRLLNLEGARYDENTKKWYQIADIY